MSPDEIKSWKRAVARTPEARSLSHFAREFVSGASNPTSL
jgi:hypothetical protein